LRILTRPPDQQPRRLFDEVDADSGGGSGSDLVDATALCAALHRSFGLSDGLLTLGSQEVDVGLLRIDPELRAAVEHNLQQRDTRARRLVEEHRTSILAVADALDESRVLAAEQVRRIVDKSRSHGLTVKRKRRAPRESAHLRRLSLFSEVPVTTEIGRVSRGRATLGLSSLQA
jgi:hypothetical protein